MTVYLHGTGIIPFGRYPDRTLEDLAVPAAAGALAEAAATPDGIGGGISCYDHAVCTVHVLAAR
jgi:acetyl-CoA acetyltransferase